ncbi:MAG: class I SAM-dependent methyltransferase [Trueperaceae bacterium]|nr:class I SAM-dependent methyltransferase [Trueperaceae bacterium]
MDSVILKPGRERSLLRKHPWVFSGAVQRLEGKSGKGTTIDVHSADGQFLGRGAYSPASQIRVRIWSFSEESIDENWFQKRILEAFALRESLGMSERSNAYRLIASEADKLPGLTIDRYADTLVCQFLSAGVEVWKASIISVLKQLPNVQCIYERSDVNVRKKEGLEPTTGLLWGKEPEPLIPIDENGLNFYVDVKQGHKTGFYLDQRSNRQKVREASKNAEVLNCFAYTGGFGMAALKGGAKHVTNLEDVAGLLELMDKNVALNQFNQERCTNLKADVFKQLRTYQKENKKFDLIVLDPPKFAESQGQLSRASRGYKDINRLAFHLLRPGGLLFTFSCSGLMKLELFQKIVADAALDAGRDAQIIDILTQGSDHLIDLTIPETWYLKGLIVRVA